MNDLMTVQEVAKYFRIHHITVYRWIKHGKIKASQAGKGGHWRVRREDVEGLLV